MTKPELIAELGRRIRKIEHPELTNEEALKKELGVGCQIIAKHNGRNAWVPIHRVDAGRYYIYSGFGDIVGHEYMLAPDGLIKEYIILGLPITLPRVLAALPDGYKLTNFKATNLAGGYWVQICDRWGEDDEICCWLLTKIGLKSSRDATADDQSEETLKALIDLFPSND